MAAIYREQSNIEHGNGNGNGNGNEISRQDIQAAIAKAVELRALHASLMQGSSPAADLRLPSSSPLSRHASHFSAQDYPVFTPSYEDEPLPGYQKIMMENRNYAESWGEYNLDVDETTLEDYRRANASSRKGLATELMSLEEHICQAEDQTSVTGSILRASPGPDYLKSRRNSLGDMRSVSSCNNYAHSSLHPQPRNKVLSLSWLFPKLKKKSKNDNSPIRPQPEEMPQMGVLSMETLKKELMEAHESRDAALTEVAGMKSSLGELSQKLEYLETYCEELKKVLRQRRQAVQGKNPPQLMNVGRSIDGNAENSMMPVSEEAMVEGFLQIVSEARLAVKQFCKTLVGRIEESDHTLLDNLNSLLQPYKLSLNSKYSKAVLYHLEATINQSLYQDFENCIFQKNGTPKLLDPQLERQAQFQLFVALRNLSWNEVLRKGTKYYSDEFSKFCDQKMSCIIATLGWTRPWPEQLLQAFFVAAKCIWLLHLLAFSFYPPLSILRVEENRPFEPHYMEDVFADKRRPQGPSRVKIMVMPGFYAQDKILRCKVLCRYKSGV